MTDHADVITPLILATDHDVVTPLQIGKGVQQRCPHLVLDGLQAVHLVPGMGAAPPRLRVVNGTSLFVASLFDSRLTNRRFHASRFVASIRVPSTQIPMLHSSLASEGLESGRESNSR